jgi:cobalt-zinc-cadmium efflux system protein
MTEHAHSHDEGHDHNSGHAHSHAPASFGLAFAIGISLNTIFVVIEGIYGYFANSTALLADAGHNLGDVFGLFIAWAAAALSRRAPTQRYTYGLKGTSILAALFNAVFLLLTVGAIAWESIQRLGSPEPVSAKTVMVVATIGIAVNGITAWLFASGRKGDLNIRGAFLHMAADAAVAAGVVAAGAVILWTGWVVLDPIVSLGICAVIVWGTWSLLTESVQMSLAGVPDSVEVDKVRRYIEHLPGVSQLHDLHIWPMSTTETALTCHLVMPAGHPGDEFLMNACQKLSHDFFIAHATIQIEININTVCRLAPDDVV